MGKLYAGQLRSHSGESGWQSPVTWFLLHLGRCHRPLLYLTRHQSVLLVFTLKTKNGFSESSSQTSC